MVELRCDERPGSLPGKPFEPFWSFAPGPFCVVGFCLGAPDADNGSRRGAGYEGESLERIPLAALWLNGMVELRCDQRRIQASGNPLNPFGASLGRPVSRGDAYSFVGPLWTPGRGDVPEASFWVSFGCLLHRDRVQEGLSDRLRSEWHGFGRRAVLVTESPEGPSRRERFRWRLCG